MGSGVRRLISTTAVLTVAFVALAAPLPCTAAQEADEDSLAQAWEDDVEQQQGWLSRTAHRFFGRAPLSGEDLSGRAEQTVDPYAQYVDRDIEVIIIHPVLRFTAKEDTTTSSMAWLSSLARRVSSYTRESVIRQYLLFERGDTLDPYALADSERMLRQLPYINDARLLVLPVGGAADGVAIIVEYRDRWPYGIAGRIKTQERYEMNIYTSNLGGVGLLFDNKIIRNNLGDPQTGYRGILAKENLGGSFVDAMLEYEDSWQELDFLVGLQRRQIHPAIHYVGGIAWQVTDDRDNEGVPREFEDTSLWAGRVIQLSEDRTFATGLRRTLTPALSYGRRWFRERPVTRADTNRAYHHSRILLAGLTDQRVTDYKTSYLFRMGEVEDVPAGMAVQLSGGYETGEYLNRTAWFFDSGGSLVRERGDLLWADFACGGYLRNGRLEDGLVDAMTVYITPLLGAGRYRHRTYVWLRYTLGLNQTGDTRLALGGSSLVRNLERLWVRGGQRLLTSLEFRLFTPWSLLGFRTMPFAYGDVGVVGDEDDPLFTNKIYSTLGLGVRLENPSIVLPAAEFRFGIVQNVDDRGFGVAFNLGNLVYPELRLPGVRPGRVAFR